jgi:uncharacterized protein
MDTLQSVVIKSFKHDGKLHRLWKQNWLVPHSIFPEGSIPADTIVLVNDRTPICEADGNWWTSRVPSVAYFFPGQWYNVVALLEESGVRHYCNVASPCYSYEDTLTYIDYDLDVIRYPSGRYDVVDRQEFRLHKEKYRYTPLVIKNVESGLDQVIRRMDRNDAVFQADLSKNAYAWLKKALQGGVI